jgi:DnaK suppressor protein
MNKADLDRYREKLLALRTRLRGDVNNLANAALKKTRMEASGDLSAAPLHMADVGTDAYEQEFTLSLMEADEGTLGQIDAALERIRQASYGTCEDCGGRIPKARLDVIPFTSTCVKCAEKRSEGKFATDNS